MASPKIIPKKSVISKIPLSTDLENGEICINHADRKLYAKHPSTGAIQEIGAYAHSHDELYSLNGTQHLELQNNGSLVLNGSTTLTLPSASGTLATLADITGGQQADWNATSGTAQILNKPTLGTAAATNSTAYATAAQGATADSALQASALTPYRTSAAQDNIDAGFAASTHTHAATDITSGTLNDSRLSANVVLTSDARLSNARTPTNHASTHATGGTDAISPSSIGAAATSHQHPLSDLTQSSATTGQVAAWNGTAWAPSTPAAAGVSSVAGRTGAVTLTLADVPNVVGSVTTGIANTTPITNMMQITSAGYSTITPAANTLYIIVG